MNCQFSHLDFGKEYVLHITGNSNCSECGSDTRALLDDSIVIYQGHVGDMDMFNLKFPFHCPSCGIYLNGYGEHCGGLSVDFLIKEVIHDER